MNLLLKMKRIKDLSPSERQVVNFFLLDPEKASNLGIVEIAKQTYTSSSTVMRLIKKLDYCSFIDFKIDLATDIGDYLENSIVFKEQKIIELSDSTKEIIDKVTSNNARAVIDIKKLNDVEVFEKVANMIGKATKIDFYGSGLSNLICQDAMMKALRLGINTTSYSFYTEMAMYAKTSDSNHLAFIISYTGQTSDTINIAKILKKNDVPTVSITSNTDNILLELCSVNLFVGSFESVYRVGGMSSRISSQHVLDILFTIYMNKNYEKLKDVVNKTFVKETFDNSYDYE